MSDMQPMCDMLQRFNVFAKQVADCLTQNQVVPPDEGMAALMVIIGDEPDVPPIAGTLNWDKDEKKWEVSIQLNQAKSLP